MTIEHFYESDFEKTATGRWSYISPRMKEGRMRTRFDDRLKVLHGSAGSDHDPLADHPALKRAVPPTPERYDPGPVPGDPIRAHEYDERVRALRAAQREDES